MDRLKRQFVCYCGKSARRTLALVISVSWLASVTLLLIATPEASAAGEDNKRENAVLEFVDEYKTPGLETELSGICPHPTDNNLYFVVTNGRPTYKPSMKPMLPEKLRNKLLTVNRNGEVVKVMDLPYGGGLFGDLKFADGHLWLGPLDPPAIWKLNLETGKVIARYTLPGPAGGMEYDRDRSLIYVQSYIGHPHLAVVDPKTGAVVKSLWSDENCQGMAKVDGDLLTVYTSSWDADAYTELWALDPETGKPLSRTRMEGIHAAMAPLDKKIAGFDGFMTLMHRGSGVTGETVIRRYRYVGQRSRATADARARDRKDKVAAIQFAPMAVDAIANRERLTELITRAAEQGARYIVVPELSTRRRLPLVSEDGDLSFVELVTGPTAKHFTELAKRLGVWLAFSLPERAEEGDGYYITSLLVDDRGRVASKSRKRVLRPNGQDGNARVGFARILMESVDDRGRRIATISGDDLQSGVMRLAERGADAILVTANWSSEDPIQWLTLCQELAKQFNLNLIVANRNPELGGIFSPDAPPLLPNGSELEQTILATVSMSQNAGKIRSSLGLPSVPIPTNSPMTPGVIELGRALFFDANLSSSGKVSCASCHKPESFFADGKARGEGVFDRKTSRNVPSLLNVAYRATLQWDGNPTTIEQQVKYPLTGSSEMNLRSYDDLIVYVRSQKAYVDSFRSEFGLEPEDISREHIARAIASFERTLVSGESAFDRYYYGNDKQALTERARRGLSLFGGKAGCVNCHPINADYALFMDGRFHTLGIGYVVEKGLYADPGVGTVSNRDYAGMFFTPSLRNIAETGPYMHDGSVKTLEEAIEVHYGSQDPNARRDPALKSVTLSRKEIGDLVEFLRSLTGTQRYTSRGELIDRGASDHLGEVPQASASHAGKRP